jgi:LSD1 subclass zinc finger protein
MTEVPDLIEPVVGFRLWQVDSRGLRSLANRTVWHRAVLAAECRLRPNRFALDPQPHAAPHPNCSCGIYALHQPGSRFDRVKGDDLVWGIVTLWGRIEVHAAGMRVECARIHALSPRAGSSAECRSRLERIAAKFGGIPIIYERDLEESADAFGRRLGTDLIPSGRVSTFPLRILYRATSGLDRPALRFVFGERGGHVYPWGWWPWRELVTFSNSWRGAIGDIFARNDDYAVATFARVTPELRRAAEAHLQTWALEDGWTLETAPGLLPLAQPKHMPDGRTIVCRGCRRQLRFSRGVATHFRRRGFQPSRCQHCWSRYTEIRIARGLQKS